MGTPNEEPTAHSDAQDQGSAEPAAVQYPIEPTEKVTMALEDLGKLIDVNLPLEAGKNYYLIADKWFTNYQRFCRLGKDMDDKSFHPGPIDNGNLYDEYTQKMKNHLVDRLHYYLLSEEQWNKLVSWFGLRHPPIIRKCIEVQGYYSKSLIVEVYPRKLTLLYKPETGSQQEKEIEISRASTVADLKKAVCDFFRVPNDENARIKKKDTLDEKELTEMDKQLDAVLDSYLTEKILLETKEASAEWPVETTAYSSGSSYSSSNYSGYSNYSSSSNYSSTYPSTSSYSSYPSSSTGYSGYSSGSYSSSKYDKYDRYDNYSTSKPPPAKGATGLGNLGNTCFMNSGIQCLSNTRPLAKHFLEGKHTPEINKSNPLGMEGKIAEEFGNLLNDLWAGKYSSVSPRELKSTIGRFAPQFSGYNQQDSQELLAFLLDGLHEDLNRIVKKPYVEIKDSAGRPDEEVAAEAWEAHKKRNDSIIADLFLGQFKSRVTCPECKKVSLTFDPFLFLSLPLPAIETRAVTVTFVPQDPSLKLKKVKVLVPKRGSVTLLRDKVSEAVGVPNTHLTLAEIYDFRFHTFYFGQSLREIRDDDEVFAYEAGAPVKLPIDDEKKSTTKINLRLLIQVISVVTYTYSNYRSTVTKNKGIPLILTVDEDISYPDLYKEVKRHLNRFSTRPLDEVEQEKKTSQPPEESEMQVVEEADAAATSEESEKMETDDPDKKPKAKEPKALFKIQSTQSYSYSNEDLDTSGKPLGLKDSSFIAAVWEKDDFSEVFRSNFAEDIEEVNSITKEEGEEPKLSVKTCLELFLKEEVLGAENAWFCPQCKEDRQANKKFDIWRLPDVLVVHLKRFSYNSYSRDKIDSLVEFPLTDLDLSEYVLNKQAGETHTYDLFAVSNHFGGLGGGHYTAYAKNALDGHWYNFDDSSVSKVDSSSIQTSAAYVLFYQRKGKFSEASVEAEPSDTKLDD